MEIISSQPFFTWKFFDGKTPAHALSLAGKGRKGHSEDSCFLHLQPADFVGKTGGKRSDVVQ